MHTTGIAMVKDECDIVAITVQHMLRQVDDVIVADNMSTDGTYERLLALAEKHNNLHVMRDTDPAYYQAMKMTALAAVAAKRGADWVVPFDADEVWYSPFGSVASVLGGMPELSIATAELHDHVATGKDPAGTNPVLTIQWRRRKPSALPKVACRAALPVNIHQGNHAASFVSGTSNKPALCIRHYPYRSVAQFISKVRNGAKAYAATSLPEAQGKHWRDYGRILEAEGEEAVAGIFRRWFWVADPIHHPDLVYDPFLTDIR